MTTPYHRPLRRTRTPQARAIAIARPHTNGADTPYLLLVLGLTLLVLLAFALPRAHAAPMDVTVSILPQKYFVERIGGDMVRVNVMVPPGADPHSYEPKPSQMQALSRSAFYFAIGAPFEKAWLPRMTAAGGKNLNVVHMEKGVTLLPMAEHDEHGQDTAHKGDRNARAATADATKGNAAHTTAAARQEGSAHADTHQAGNDAPAHAGDPHVWLSPALVKFMCLSVRDALVKADPAHAPVYRANYNAFADAIDALDARLAEQLSTLPENRRSFLVFHPSWSYFAHNYELQEVAIEVEGREPGPRQMKRIIDFAKAEKVGTIFIQPQFSRKAAQAIAREVGATLVEADPLAEDWAANLERVAQGLHKALAPR